MQQLDPLKEVSAAEKRIALNLSTQEREAAEFNGSDWNENIAQRKRETAETAGWTAGGAAQTDASEGAPDPSAPSEGDEEEDATQEENSDEQQA